MPWSGCSTRSEYIELMNFGPGPMNIGCFIVTNGQYAVTIPPNTVLQPGKYFVLSGLDSLAKNCGNSDSAVKVDLNWTSCNCTDKIIPTSGDGFLTDGGGANEKIVLMDPALKVLDAVSRSIPVSSSVPITTSSVAGGCSPATFNLGTMGISYEAINIATGIDNSYSRRVDGDCGWVKTTDISARAPNKTGSTASATYSFSTLSASECNGTTGSISIAVSAADVPSLFPMTYTLAFDKDSNNIFNDYDIYTYGVDSTASSIDINNLAYGRYRITVGSSSGCNLQSFDFQIFNCYGVLLPYKVISFKYGGAKDNKRWFRVNISGLDSLKAIELEVKEGLQFKRMDEFIPADFQDGKEMNLWTSISGHDQFRIHLIGKSNIDYYSNQIQVSESSTKEMRVWPNPAKDQIRLSLPLNTSGKVTYKLINGFGAPVQSGSYNATTSGEITIKTTHLTRGIYLLIVDGESIHRTFEFLKL